MVLFFVRVKKYKIVPMYHMYTVYIYLSIYPSLRMSQFLIILIIPKPCCTLNFYLLCYVDVINLSLMMKDSLSLTE